MPARVNRFWKNSGAGIEVAKPPVPDWDAMRMLEALIIVITGQLTLAAAIMGPRRPRWSQLLPALPGALVLAHLLLEGGRWQMMPAYAVVAGLCVFGIVRWARPAREPGLVGRAVARTAAVFGFLLVMSSAVADIQLPVFVLPTPTGPAAVGTTALVFTDQARREELSDDPSAMRTIPVQIWYPASVTHNARRASYLGDPSRIGAEQLRKAGLPSFTARHLRLVRTHSWENVPVAAGQPAYPILLFSHGDGMPLGQNTALMEELASHGYVVVSIGHPYQSIVVYPDGRLVTYRQAAGRMKEIAAMNKPARDARLPSPYTLTPAERAQLAVRAVSLQPGEDFLARMWSADIRFVLDELAVLEAAPSGLFAGRLDMRRVGALGHSFGGAASGQACLDDPRIGAGLNMDGLQSGDMLRRPIGKPFLFMNEDRLDGLSDPFYASSTGPAYEVIIKGAVHDSFTDMVLWSPFSVGRAGGDLEAARGLRIVNAYVLAFFDRYLKGVAAPLLDASPAPYPEVTIRERLTTRP